MANTPSRGIPSSRILLLLIFFKSSIKIMYMVAETGASAMLCAYGFIPGLLLFSADSCCMHYKSIAKIYTTKIQMSSVEIGERDECCFRCGLTYTNTFRRNSHVLNPVQYNTLLSSFSKKASFSILYFSTHCFIFFVVWCFLLWLSFSTLFINTFHAQIRLCADTITIISTFNSLNISFWIYLVNINSTALSYLPNLALIQTQI